MKLLWDALAIGKWLTRLAAVQNLQSPLATASPEAIAWMKKMWSDPVLKTLAKDYFRQAENPETLVEKYEGKFKANPDIQFGRFERTGNSLL